MFAGLLSYYRKLRVVLPADARPRLLRVLLVSGIVNLIDLLGTLSVLPFILALARPDFVYSNAYLKAAYEGSGAGSTATFLLILLAAAFVFYIFKNALVIRTAHLKARFAFDMSTRVAERQLRYYASQPESTLKVEDPYVLVNKSINNPAELAFGILLPLAGIFGEVLIFVFIVVGVVWYDPLIALMLPALLVPAGLLLYRLTQKRATAIGVRANQLVSQSYNTAHSIIKGLTDLRLLQAEEHFIRRAVGLKHEADVARRQLLVMNSVPRPIIETVALLGIVVLAVYALLFTPSAEELFIFLCFFAAAAYRVMPSVARLLNQVVFLRHYGYCLDILAESAGYEAPARAAGHAEPLPFKASLSAEGLTFRYPGRDKPALQDAAFEIRKGEFVGVRGGSGEGKTTFIKLLAGILMPETGCIRIDGQPLTPADLPGWWGQIAYVGQSLFLADGTFRANINPGGGEPDPERLAEAVRLSGLQAVIDELPEGPDTDIGQDGDRLSGGQRQRLGIARAVYKQADLILMDEATNALDDRTAETIIETVEQLRKAGKTIVMISHRIEQLADCDKIITVSGGRLTVD